MKFSIVESLVFVLVVIIIYFHTSIVEAKTYKIAGPNSSTNKAIELFSNLVSQDVEKIKIKDFSNMFYHKKRA